MRLLVSGGYFDDSGECFIDRVDLVRCVRERLVSFIPPAPHRIPGKGFTGAAWLDETSMLVCSFDAVWRIDATTGRVTGRLHQPDFNDLHAVNIDSERALIHVCNTGLDAVETFDLSGNFVARVGTSPAWFEAARQQGAAVERTDFARVLHAGWSAQPRPEVATATGPYYQGSDCEPFHRRKARDYTHPNHLVRWGEHLTATMLATRELRCMGCHRTLARLAAPPHDGVAVDDDLWVTTTDGRVWRVAPTGASFVVLDGSQSGHVGWCRGLVVDTGSLAIGLTAIHTPPQYAWRDDPRERTETSVLWLDRVTGALRGRVGYEEPHRRAKVFSLLVARGPWA